MSFSPFWRFDTGCAAYGIPVAAVADVPAKPDEMTRILSVNRGAG